jgi:hypothetical protein
MKAGTLSLAAVAVVAIGAFAIKVMFERPTAREGSETGHTQTADSISSAVSRVQQPRTVAISHTNSVAAVSASTSNPSIQNSPTNTAAARPAKKPLMDPFARIALTFVGADPDAEDYWFAAINDLSLPANERQDLIEDLNEEGLSDPKHPTIEDLPLIFNRLALIETIGPDAADEVNAAAFDEAYKDLLNLAALAMGGGQAVR